MSVFKRLRLLRERGSHWFEVWSLQYPITAGVVSASTSFAMMTVNSTFSEALLSFGNVLAHEMGHAILGLYRGRRPLRMIFRSDGGLVSFDVRQKPLTVDDIPIFLGGPYAQSLYWVFVGLFLGKSIAWKKVFVKSTFIGDAIDMSGSDQQRTFKFIRELSTPHEGDRVLELEIISQCCRVALKLLGIYAAKMEYRSWKERLSIYRARIDVVSTIAEVMMKLVRLLTRYRLRAELLQHFAKKFGTKSSMVDL